MEENGCHSAPKEGPVSLRHRYKAFGVDGEGLFLVSDRDYQVLEGQIFVDVLPFLQRGVDVTAIVDALEVRYPPTVIYYACELLARHQLLTRTPYDGDLRKAAFWDELDLEPQVVSERLAATTVALTIVGAVNPSPTILALNALGMKTRLTDAATDEALHVVITDDYLAPSLFHIAASNRRNNRPWLLARGTGAELWVGPIFANGSACFECLSWRLRTNGALEEYLRRRLGDKAEVSKAIASTEVHSILIGNIVALEAAKWVAGYAAGEPHIKAIDMRTLQSSKHLLQQRPQCPLCGNPQLQTEILTLPVRIAEEQPPVQNTLDHFSPFVSSITGIITSLARAETGIQSLHSYTAYFGFGRGAPDLQGFKNGLLSQAAGVGTNAEEAKIGAICEAIERYSGMYHGDEPAIRACYAELDPETTVHPNACMLYSVRQYEQRVTINAKGAAFNLVPYPFDETAALDWTGVWSLSAQRFKLLPSTYLFYSYPQPRGGPFCWADSNGCAAGKTLTDAIRRGLLELIERDSVAIWWYNRLRRPQVDLSSYRSEYFDVFVEAYRQLKRDIWVLNITTDLGIPSFAAISRYTCGEPEDILVSFGAHLDPRVAIEHALNEMNHLLPAVLPANRNAAGDYAYPDASQINWWRTATIHSESYLLPNAKYAPLQAAESLISPSSNEVEQTTALCRILQEHGLEVLVINQTRPDLKLPVAKVIVPGLRHFWARFAPGRLYDVPVTMGWLERFHIEQELNPIAMFL